MGINNINDIEQMACDMGAIPEKKVTKKTDGLFERKKMVNTILLTEDNKQVLTD